MNDIIFILEGNKMEVFAEYFEHIDSPQHQARTKEVLAGVSKKFPNLIPKIAWDQQLFG